MSERKFSVGDVFAQTQDTGHELVSFAQDAETGLRAIVAVHSTALGPALGGTRYFPYPNGDAALADVLRLSQAMTYKAAAAELALGGGKAVILGDPAEGRSEPLLEAFGRVVDRLGGTYVTAEDVGTTVDDMVVIRRETAHVAGLPVAQGGSGDPSPYTARGVEAAMRAVSSRIWGTSSLAGRRVAVLGVGKVGAALVDRLRASDAEVVVADVSSAALEMVTSKHDLEVVSTRDALTLSCDLLAPCALGGGLDLRVIQELRCAAVVGAANNQLSDPANAEALRRRGVVYAPDFVANAGGLINIAEEAHGYDPVRAAEAVDAIEGTMGRILDTAQRRDIDTATAAISRAQERIRMSREAEVAA